MDECRLCTNKVDFVLDRAPIKDSQAGLVHDRLLDLLVEQLLRWVLLVLTCLNLLLELVLLYQLHFVDELLEIVADLAGLTSVFVCQIVVLPLHALPL